MALPTTALSDEQKVTKRYVQAQLGVKLGRVSKYVKASEMAETMTDEEKDNILDRDIPTSWCCERINDSLYDSVFRLFSEEIYKWEENDLGEKMRNGTHGFGN
jgi:hypothetical protein